MLDDNPFDDMPDEGGAFNDAVPPPRPPKSQDAYVAPARPPKPATTTTTSSATTIDMADYERRLAELEARERAVAERERKVAQDQSAADQKMQQAMSGMPSKPEPNWPPCLPKKIAYQDFRAEIPDVVRTRVRMAYYHFLATLIILLYNLVCAISCLIGVSAGAIGDLILACVYIPFLGAMNFFVYRRLYKAAKSGSSLSYFMFYIFFTIEILIAILAVVGPTRSGLMGIIWTVEAFDEENGNKTVGVMCLVNSILWAISAGFMIYIWIHTRVNFSQAGGIKAMRKQAVEKATFGVVKAAKDHPDAAKKVGEAAVDYARENPEVVRGAASAAYDVSTGY